MPRCPSSLGQVCHLFALAQSFEYQWCLQDFLPPYEALLARNAAHSVRVSDKYIKYSVRGRAAGRNRLKLRAAADNESGCCCRHNVLIIPALSLRACVPRSPARRSLGTQTLRRAQTWDVRFFTKAVLRCAAQVSDVRSIIHDTLFESHDGPQARKGGKS